MNDSSSSLARSDIVRAIAAQSGHVIHDANSLDGGRAGSIVTTSQSSERFDCPALGDLLILAVHDYQLTSAMVDLGWGYREHFSSARNPIHVIPPHTEFSWILNGAMKGTFLTIDRKLAGETFEELGVAASSEGLWEVCHKGFSDPFIYASVSTLSEQMSASGCPRLLIESYISTILFKLSAQWLNTKKPDTGPTRLPMRTVTDVIEFIHTNLEQDLALEALAAIAGLSKYHFVRSFKSSTGVSPYQYLIERRIDRARRLLDSTDMPISNIAHSCGFSDTQSLNRLFKKQQGMSPSAWRVSKARHTE